MRVGLVLGAGGVLGGSWTAGALRGLSEHLGWDPASAECIVGTSAGSVVGAMLACGVSPSYLAEHCAGNAEGRVSEALGDAEASRRAADASRGRRRPADCVPGSPRLALASLARPHRYAPVAVVAGWLPRGLADTEPLKEAVRAAAATTAAPHPGFEAVACDYATGRRETFAAARWPLADAVAASCAIPGYYRPVDIAGRRFVDGAVHSMSNLDVLAGRGLDLVICLSPMSSRHSLPAGTVGERALGALRRDAGRRLGREAGRVRASGTQTLLLQPTAEDLAAMAEHATDAEGRRRVVDSASASVREHLRDHADIQRLHGVPLDDHHRAPARTAEPRVRRGDAPLPRLDPRPLAA